MHERNTMRWSLLVLSLLILFSADLALGSVRIPFNVIFRVLFAGEEESEVIANIIKEFRLPKALTCTLAGSALSIAGLQMQTLFRNALAGPDVLGLSSGASLAVALVFLSSGLGLPLFIDPHPAIVSIAASAGALVILLIMLGVAGKLNDSASLLIVGLMVGATAASIVSVLQYISEAQEMQTYLIWTFGTLGGLDWTELAVLAAALIVGAVLAISQIKSLNAWMLGDNYAVSLGINLTRARVLILLSASVLTGAVTAFCGPIAFVGLAVPHLTRLIIDSQNHRTLVPAVAIGGAILVLFCDIVSQLPFSNYVLPINALTALIGAPVVIWIIIRHKRIRV